MLGTLVEERIADVAGLKLVEGAAGFAALRQGDKLTLPRVTPAAYVVVLQEQPGPDLRDTGLSVAQDVMYHVAIITVVKFAGDTTGDKTNALSDQIRSGIKNKIFGWTPAGFDEAFARGPSVLFDFDAGAHWHQDEFFTKRLEVPENE